MEIITVLCDAEAQLVCSVQRNQRSVRTRGQQGEVRLGGFHRGCVLSFSCCNLLPAPSPSCAKLSQRVHARCAAVVGYPCAHAYASARKCNSPFARAKQSSKAPGMLASGLLSVKALERVRHAFH